jgi:hypothetical protein
MTTWAKERLRHGIGRPPPWLLIAAANWIFWSLGIETVGRRLTTEIDGVVIARQEIPREWYTPRKSGIAYIVRSNGLNHEVVSGWTDDAIPHYVPVGVHLVKHKWEMTYLANGRPVGDFPWLFYSAMFGIGLGCLLWAGVQLGGHRSA